jgi:hypothetical protein
LLRRRLLVRIARKSFVIMGLASDFRPKAWLAAS